MTAEIAILNKLAVALAADSAVTISTGAREEKIFDSADKLFELSRNDPIGVMIYNGMEFAEVPFQTLINKFRSECDAFRTVENAASRFLHYLNSTGVGAPDRVKRNQIEQVITPLLKKFEERRQQALIEYFQNIPPDADADQINSSIAAISSNIFAFFMQAVERMPDANFVGDGPLEFDDFTVAVIQDLVSESSSAQSDLGERLVELTKSYLTKGSLSSSLTGVVITGFGSGELFPTLISYEIDGMVCNRLKYMKTNAVDIDRQGKRAAVIPFAQKEMVERFLYGIDVSIQNDISEFCVNSVNTLTESLLSRVQFDDPSAKQELEREAQSAEQAFIEGLTQKSFQAIRSAQQAEIEDMVEFMPKPELAKMAEALVNLTSIKRKVSRGFETVGGPIDVAVISQSEGFIWVKRKHYFDPELNARYFQRAQSKQNRLQETAHATASDIGPSSGPTDGQRDAEASIEQQAGPPR